MNKIPHLLLIAILFVSTFIFLLSPASSEMLAASPTAAFNPSGLNAGFPAPPGGGSVAPPGYQGNYQYQGQQQQPAYQGGYPYQGQQQQPAYQGSYSYQGQQLQPTYQGQQLQPTYQGQQLQPTYQGQQLQPTYQGQQLQPAYQGQQLQPTYQGQQLQPTYQGQQQPSYQGQQQPVYQGRQPPYQGPQPQPPYQGQQQQPAYQGQQQQPAYQGQQPQPPYQVGYPSYQGQQPLPLQPGDTGGVKAPQFFEVSDLEKSMSEVQAGIVVPHPQAVDGSIVTQFGYNFFRPDAVGFAPLMDVPVGPDYVIGPGDRIILNVWGGVEAISELEVNRSGEIVLPRVGAVKVWGTSFGNLPSLIKSQLSKVFKGFDLNVTMGKLRMIKIYVVGEVRGPGDYNISSLSTLINALSAAGGPTKKGSLRNIQVRRRDAPPESVDLYDFFLKGDKSRDIRLRPGDTIFVPSIGRVAAVAGNVRKPAIYELKEEKSLKDLLSLADGIVPSSYLQRVQVLRTEAHDKQIAVDFNLAPNASSKTVEELTAGIAVQDMDFVKIFSIDRTQRNSVRLQGYVLRPGDYALKPGMRVRELIGEDNLKLWEYNADVAVISRLMPPNYSPEKVYINLGKAMAGDPKENIELQEFDTLQVFSRWEMEEMPRVNISGEVQKPGIYRLYENMRLRDLVLEAGNVKNTAFQGNVEITRLKLSKESVSSYSINVNLQEALKENPGANILLEPYDEVQIRKIPNWMDETNKYVNLLGEVKYPGVYAISKGEKLSSVILRAGGFTEKAYLKGARFTRAQVKELQQKRMDEVLSRTEQEIAKKQAELASVATSKEELEATKATLQALMQNTMKLKQAKAEGRISIRISPPEKLKDTPYDIELMGGDALDVPQSVNAVNVFGEVYNPTTVVQLPGKDVSYYLKMAGGPTSNAEEDEMYVIKADGTVVSKQQSTMGIRWDEDGKKWSFGGFLAMGMDAGDTLVVPQDMERIAWMREIKDIAIILGQLALAAGVVLAL